MVFGKIEILGWEACQLNVEMAYLEAKVNEEMQVELLETCLEIRNQVGLLEKAVYGLVDAGLLWSKKFGTELEANRLNRSQADPCVFRQVLHGKVFVVIVA